MSFSLRGDDVIISGDEASVNIAVNQSLTILYCWGPLGAFLAKKEVKSALKGFQYLALGSPKGLKIFQNDVK